MDAFEKWFEEARGWEWELDTFQKAKLRSAFEAGMELGFRNGTESGFDAGWESANTHFSSS